MIVHVNMIIDLSADKEEKCGFFESTTYFIRVVNIKEKRHLHNTGVRLWDFWGCPTQPPAGGR